MTKVEYKRSGAAVYITLNNPPLHILDKSAIEELLKAVQEARGDREARVIVVGHGPSEKNVCSAGVNVGDELDSVLKSGGDLLIKFRDLLKALVTSPKPTICAVKGRCFGGGVELFTACDLVAASEDSEFALPEVTLGAYPPFIAALWPKIIGLHKAYEVLMLARGIKAKEAEAMGLVNFVVPAQELDKAVESLVDDLSKKSLATLSIIKKAVLSSYALPEDKALDEAFGVFLNELVKTHDYVEGMRSFVEKRKPSFTHS